MDILFPWQNAFIYLFSGGIRVETCDCITDLSHLKFDPLSVLLTYSRYIFLSCRNLADSQKAYFVNGESTISYLLGMITIFINK
jgi:hypothetical protein